MAPYDIYQQVFALSMASNLIHNEQGPLSKLQTEIETCLAGALPMIGKWSVAWGPVVYQDKENTNKAPDNVWYVAKQPQVLFSDSPTPMDTYVVAIAGTCENSDYDWKTEDLDVGNVVDVNAWIKAGLLSPPTAATNVKASANLNPYISMGTALGVSILLTTPVPTDGGAVGGGSRLGDFLESVPSTARIIFTGHSLGGALSPTLAFTWWKSSMARNVTLGNVLTYPTAGPSPGNDMFASDFRTTFPYLAAGPVGYQKWNSNLVNTLDVVPLAWCTDASVEPLYNLHRIPSFDNVQPSNPGIDWATLTVAVNLLILRADSSEIVYRPLTPNTTFVGQGQQPISTPDDTFQQLPQLPQWEKDASYHHVDEYFIEMMGFPMPPVPEKQPLDLKVDYLRTARWPVLSAIIGVAGDPQVRAEVEKLHAEQAKQAIK
ncbi:hypothetical protein FIBSPDRAFT_1037950 [Athelia psychrophila]|uniref:Fungal lipase-type domain-containing protein n=1 Tax=Athelia psychrophila TaxID=1759441 RepID=A0A166TJ68_9AGAM|nr:hypothetical protein FIBSPDRAFT_1037950 [Fibularhizoctonia sp. CBS 109695]